jgi:hypothetical protein
VTKWEADIISLSMGFAKNTPEMEKSLDSVPSDTIIFAAASNRRVGSTYPVHPARDDRVICVHSANSDGAPSDGNPPAEGGKDLMTLGQDVPSAWPRHLLRHGSTVPSMRSSGTSVATAVLASTAGLLLQFLRQDDNPFIRWAATLLKTSSNMKRVLYKLAPLSYHNYRYLEPFDHIDGSEGDDPLSEFSPTRGLHHLVMGVLQKTHDFNDYKQPIQSPSAKGHLASVPESVSMKWLLDKNPEYFERMANISRREFPIPSTSAEGHLASVYRSVSKDGFDDHLTQKVKRRLGGLDLTIDGVPKEIRDSSGAVPVIMLPVPVSDYFFSNQDEKNLRH